MTFLRTALASALLGISAASFAAMPTPNPDPAAREARMQEALDHYRAKQAQAAPDTTQTKVSHAKHRRHHHSAKHRAAKAQSQSDKAKDQTQ